jgi:hypothetical protein
VSANQDDGVKLVTAVDFPTEQIFFLSTEGLWLNSEYKSGFDFDHWLTS